MYVCLQCENEWKKTKTGGNLGICFYYPAKRAWSLDRDCLTAEKGVTLRAIRCSDWLCRVKEGNYCGKRYEPSLDLWVDGVTMYEEREQKRRAGEFGLGCLCHTWVSTGQLDMWLELSREIKI